MNINEDISIVKGIGTKTKETLNKCGIFTILDFLLYFPREYEINEHCSSIDDVKESKKVTLKVKVKSIKKDAYIRKKMIITTIIFNDGKVDFKAKWFNQPYMKKNFIIGECYNLYGKVEVKNGKKLFLNPKVVNIEDMNEIHPIYSLKEKLSNKFFIKINNYILSNIEIKENLPSNLLKENKLCSLDEAIRNIHKPSSIKNLEKAKKRLKFQELFTYSLKLYMIKKIRTKKGISFKIAEELKVLKEKIPYTLTCAQNKVIREILLDEKKNVPMNRLLQGDVGSGKTIVSIIALFNVIKNGYQGVLMAPTEILAMQHYMEAKNLLKDFNVNIELLSGSVSNKNKKIIKEDLRTGKIDIIIGTHALLEDDVQFKKLGMIITDEQHRFGVKQRNKLFNKNENVDLLVMTATPIPRTLTLTLYGDLDISCIDELPPGRKKVDTYSVGYNMRKRVYNFALKEIKNGQQVYIVSPLVEENEKLKISSVEKLYLELKEKYFNDIEIAILHGKMVAKDKKDIMERFKEGEIKALISTTVIEVGVNVPNATLMIIENAERFGLSQLHQLRGRVGRGNEKSYCILVTEQSNPITKKRMEVMSKSNDGFFIAEEDLRLRGSGEIFGLHQHGEEGFLLAQLPLDMELFKIANKEAKNITNSDLNENILIKKEILDKLEKTSKYICFN